MTLSNNICYKRKFDNKKESSDKKTNTLVYELYGLTDEEIVEGKR